MLNMLIFSHGGIHDFRTLGVGSEGLFFHHAQTCTRAQDMQQVAARKLKFGKLQRFQEPKTVVQSIGSFKEVPNGPNVVHHRLLPAASRPSSPQLSYCFERYLRNSTQAPGLRGVRGGLERPTMDTTMAAPRVARRIKFRLDDGSLIGDSNLLGVDGNGIVRVAVDKSVVDRNLASEKDLERLQRLLSHPELPQLPQQNGGYDGPPTKKARLDSRPSLSAGANDWVAKCRELIQQVIRGLKSDARWFMDRVSEKDVPDYYTVIKRPMWINLIVQKLDSGEYASAQDFAEDVRMIWANCILYNPQGTQVRLIGEKAEKRWRNEWANSGLAGERTKRITAGVAAPKYDPDFEPPAPKATTDRPTRSGNAQKRQPPPAPAPAPSRQAANGGRAYSHEVTSGGKGREKALSLERRNQIATELQNALGELSEDQLSELMGLLPSEAMQPDEAGEMELDFEALDDANLRKLEAWLRNVRGQGPVSPSHISHNPSVRLEAGDVDDEDYHSD